jgi:hypothetical protein
LLNEKLSLSLILNLKLLEININNFLMKKIQISTDKCKFISAKHWSRFIRPIIQTIKPF